MRIDVWADVACPFCYLGTAQLERALASFPRRDQVEVRYHSFQLDPDAPVEAAGSGMEMLARKFGRSVEETRRMTRGTEERAAAEGLHIDHEAIQPVNTFDAHRLVHLATEHGAGHAVLMRLYQAYFSRGENVADHDTLAAIGAEAGMDEARVREMLATDEHAENVRADVRQAAERGIQGVPFFVFDRVHGLSGAQGAETLSAVFAQLWEKTA
ncbi:DsbA family oxidoreductase [Sediminivirga luteola]|uniref:DSBA oxidoreductase n=1 Tax=Sediminivirga luteola TaxID=1774748 RepID=A0A8J2TZP0_9MICO|nr:DsbA family oxidoreductase [Sediminivirga luteola]MCI2265107.1 DsbA family oxidoreductase [Sediminivirga luteola]GGA21819.1 DSBA oxidoreductase [Sediminivirga luteola]